MNFSDSEIVASVLSSQQGELVGDPRQADVLLINTCSIRDHAEQRVLNRLRELGFLKKKRPGLIIGVLGCMAERMRDELFDNSPVDLIAGPDAYRNLPELIRKAGEGQRAAHIILSEEETYSDIHPVRVNTDRISAFISVMRGCENFCSYCVVPYTRGKERSRNPETIVKESHRLFDEGIREITLLGQNVNSYNYISGGKTIGFADLIGAVAETDPMLRVRFATSHPKDLSDDLLKIMAVYPNICRSIHLPVQSGSNAVLRRMNRRYTREYYLQRVNAIRSILPGCGLSTDIIAGFCGETRDDHEQTLSLMKEAGFDSAFMFRYSERPGTAAAGKFRDDVPDALKSERLNEIIALQGRLSAISNASDEGKEFEVLVEGRSKRSADQLSGRTSQNKVVVFGSNGAKPGDYVRVKITSSTPATLRGKII